MRESPHNTSPHNAERDRAFARDGLAGILDGLQVYLMLALIIGAIWFSAWSMSVDADSRKHVYYPPLPTPQRVLTARANEAKLHPPTIVDSPDSSLPLANVTDETR